MSRALRLLDLHHNLLWQFISAVHSRIIRVLDSHINILLFGIAGQECLCVELPRREVETNSGYSTYQQGCNLCTLVTQR